MKGWVRWSLWVLVPLVLYVGAYVGCCLFPRERPVICRAGQDEPLARLLWVFKPLWTLHREVVERRAYGVLEGRWKLENEGGQVLEFRQRDGERWDLWIDKDSGDSRGIDVGVGWRFGTRRVMFLGMDAEMWFEGKDVMVVGSTSPWPGESGNRYVRVGE